MRLGETFFICWITLHQLKFFRSAIAKTKDAETYRAYYYFPNLGKHLQVTPL